MIRLSLDDSLIQVAPALDDTDPVLHVVSRRSGPSDGRVKKVSSQAGRKVQTAIPCVGIDGRVETRIGVNDAKGQPDYEVRTAHRAGGIGPVFTEAHRRVKFTFRWYGDNNRYLELRLQVSPGAEIVANRGVSEGGLNFLGDLQSPQWIEIHYDNHTHVGLSMKIHGDRNFTKWDDTKPAPPPVIRTRFQRIDDND